MTEEEIDKALLDYKRELWRMTIRPSGWEGSVLSRLGGDDREELTKMLVEFHKLCITGDSRIFDADYTLERNKAVNVYVRTANDNSPFRSDYKERLKAKELGFADWFTDDHQLYAGMLLSEDKERMRGCDLLQKTLTSRFRTTAYDNMSHKDKNKIIDRNKEYPDFDGVIPDYLGENWFNDTTDASVLSELKNIKEHIEKLINKYERGN